MNEIVINDVFVQNHLKRRRSSYGVSRFRAKNMAKQKEFTAISAPSRIASSSMVNQLSQPTPLSGLNIGSSRSERRENEIGDNGNPQRHKQCQCKQTKCLKLYCECFSSGLYCNGCKCLDCHNKSKTEWARNTAVRNILKRKPNAFRRDSPLVENQNRGCHCKKTQCLKRYCECFQANIPCSENCNCLDCKNDGHRENLVHEIIGFDEDNKTVQQVNTVTTLDSPPVLSISPPIKYRSLLADIISPHSIRNFCSRLVVESDPSKMLTEDHKVKQEDIEIGEPVLDDNSNERQKQTRTPKHNHKPNIYADQERIVLASFRDYLQKFITRGISKAEVETSPSERIGNGTSEEKVELPHLKCTSFR